MYEVLLFEDRKGESTVKDRLCELQKRAATDKRARVLLNKILEYVAILERKGTRAGEKYVKHIEGDI
jgi:phage-related protein